MPRRNDSLSHAHTQAVGGREARRASAPSRATRSILWRHPNAHILSGSCAADSMKHLASTLPGCFVLYVIAASSADWISSRWRSSGVH